MDILKTEETHGLLEVTVVTAIETGIGIGIEAEIETETEIGSETVEKEAVLPTAERGIIVPTVGNVVQLVDLWSVGLKMTAQRPRKLLVM